MTDQQSPPEPVVVKDDFATNAGWQLFRVTVVFVAKSSFTTTGSGGDC